MNTHSIYKLVLPFFRRRRFKIFQKLLTPEDSTTILDIGGYHSFWMHDQFESKIILVNIDSNIHQYARDSRFPYVRADGRFLPFKDKSFDIGFSNSVIEHLGSIDNQTLFASEILRVSKRIWVQTPNQWFWFEPHLLAPFIHFLSKRLQRPLLRWCTLWGIITKPNQKQIDDLLGEIRLLTGKEMKKLFPKCLLKKEKFLFMTKSFIAVKT